MKRAVLGLLVLGLAACQSTTPDVDAPLPPPPTGEITAPARNVPAAIAAFSGTWVGKWTSGQEARLAVQTVARDGSVTGTYSWGDLAGHARAGSTAVTGKIGAGTLTLEPMAGGATASFAMQDGTLAGAYVAGGQTVTGTFTRLQPQPADLTPEPAKTTTTTLPANTD
jgi:hypothetical protein